MLLIVPTIVILLVLIVIIEGNMNSNIMLTITLAIVKLLHYNIIGEKTRTIQKGSNVLPSHIIFGLAGG